MSTATTIFCRHLRPRGAGEAQETTRIELFFDLVYVFAITQISHTLADDLTLGGAARAAFFLLVVWWAWIYTTWMANWFDPGSPNVGAVLAGVMLASLLMAAALPGALSGDPWLFAASYVALQVGRNSAAAWLLPRGHTLRDVFERLVAWSAASGLLWLAGASLDGDDRLLLWIPALATELAAPAAGYWLPARGRVATTSYDIEPGHFAERCELFVIIALGESLVITGSTATDAGLSPTVVLCLVAAFLETAAFWWLYFGGRAERSRAAMRVSADPGRVARDAYTYVHLPIIAGIIATAVSDYLLVADPDTLLTTAGLSVALGGPALYGLGLVLFHRVTNRAAVRS